jgi:hypothetical protein
MTSQELFRCQGTPLPKIYLHQRPHEMRWRHFINDFQQKFPEN